MGFGRNRERRENEVTNNEAIQGLYHVGIMFCDVFESAEYHENATIGLGYREMVIEPGGWSCKFHKSN